MKSILSWVFRSRVNGRIVVAQFPNLSLSLYLVTRAIDWLLTRNDQPAIANPGTVLLGVRWGGAIFLAWWALDELIRGVNPWRRLLGVFGLASVLGTVLKLLA